MDLLLRDGDFGLDERGMPVQLDGVDELLQRVLIRLTVRKGAFALDPMLGSRFYALRRADLRSMEREAMAMAQEALASMKELSVTAVQVDPEIDGGATRVTVWLKVGAGEMPVTFTV